METSQLTKDKKDYNPHYLKYREQILERARAYSKKKCEERKKQRALDYINKYMNNN
jgi:hypothetical protein